MTSHHRRQDPLPEGWRVYAISTTSDVTPKHSAGWVVVDGSSLEEAMQYHNNWHVEALARHGVEWGPDKQARPKRSDWVRSYGSWAEYEADKPGRAPTKQTRKQQNTEIRRRANLTTLARTIEDFI